MGVIGPGLYDDDIAADVRDSWRERDQDTGTRDGKSPRLRNDLASDRAHLLRERANTQKADESQNAKSIHVTSETRPGTQRAPVCKRERL
jgi:hypothetical protein